MTQYGKNNATRFHLKLLSGKYSLFFSHF